MNQSETARLTPEQLEALIRHEHGVSRGLTPDGSDTESRVELECYVARRDASAA